LQLSNGATITADFFVDSTGFSRVLISKLGARWIDWSDRLPLTSAIAYSTPQNDTIKPYTSATTYSEGWHWTIPLQSRNGCGFLYNNAMTDDATVEALLPSTAYDVRKIKFTPGYLDRSFIGNCLTIGLASGFVEPLEATSIHSTIGQLFLWLKDFHSMSNNQQHMERLWTRHHSDYWHSVLDWIQLHYCNAVPQGKFWTHMATVEKTNKVKEILDLCQVRMPRSSDLDNPYLIWQHSLTMNILQGNGLLSADLARHELELFDLTEHGQQLYQMPRPYVQGKGSTVNVYR
jgi:tryptophan halogenase